MLEVGSLTWVQSDIEWEVNLQKTFLNKKVTQFLGKKTGEENQGREEKKPSVVYLFISWMEFFELKTNMMKHCQIFFYRSWFWCLIKTFLHNPWSQRFSAIIYSKILLLKASRLRCMIYLKLIFCMVWGKAVNLFFAARYISWKDYLFFSK